MQHFGKGALRVAKNYTKGYSDTQAKVREATSNDPWGPSGTQMNEIAQMTYNQGDFVEIMEMLDKRLNDKGKNWRHVFKSLTVLDYCLHAGSENVVIYFKDNLYVIKTLKEFQYVDEEGKDQGANVRQKAKDITNLLMDDARLREERRTRAHMRDRMIRGASGEFEDDGPYSARNRMPPPPQNENAARRRGPRGKDRDEEELRKAIEESKKTLAAEQAKQARDTEERDLARAIKLSEEEEENRRKALEDANEKSLFDDTQQITTQTTNSLLIDPTPYTVGLQPQYTVQPQFTSVQTHFTSFNPYQQQAQQEAMQAEYLRQQQMQLAYQQQQEQQRLQQEEWMRQQYQQQQQQQLMMQQQQQQSQFLQPQPTLQLQPQPTGFGSNNPFAPASHSPSPSSPIGPQLTATPQFNLQGTYANSAGPSFGTSPSPTPASSSSRASSAVPSMTSGMGATASMRKKDEENAALANLFANRDDGMDTFGNVGALRYGQTGLTVQPTGSHNPFARQQQQQQVNHERPFFDI